MDFSPIKVDENFPPVEWMNAPYGQQRFGEVVQMLKLIAGSRSILEIGSCFGRTLMMMAAVAKPGAKLRAVDLGYLPNGSFGFRGYDLKPGLVKVADILRANGFDVEIKFGDSHDPQVVDWARNSGPYDAVFIDADHEYHAAKKDWENYGSMGNIICFHDVFYSTLGISKLWRELKREADKAGHSIKEFRSEPMGIGVIVK